MNIQKSKPSRFLVPLIVTLFASTGSFSVQAGTATMESADGERIVWEYQNDAVRMNTGDGNDYVLVKDGEFYLVSFEDDEPTVIDGGSMMRSFASLMPDVAPDDFSAEVLGIENSGRKEDLAGLAGDVYEVRIRDQQGRESLEELVLSEAKEAREFSDALLLMAETVSNLVSPQTTVAADALSSRLADMKMGVLRYGEEVAISSISSSKISQVRFDLPAEPMDLGGLGGMLGGMATIEIPAEELEHPPEDRSSEANESNKGMAASVMGIFGKKVDRQANRVSGSVDSKVDQETDEAVDKKLNKVLGKLFGG